MSSHHIVREKQEPALFILDLDTFDEEYLGQLLEWSPTLIVAANAFDKALSLGLKVDIVVGSQRPFGLQEHTLFIAANADVLPAGMDYLMAEGYPAVNIISSDDDFDLMAKFIDKINWVWFTNTLKTFPIHTGFSFWKPAQTQLRINNAKDGTFTNLKPLCQSVFEVVDDGFVSFDFKDDFLVISEYL